MARTRLATRNQEESGTYAVPIRLCDNQTRGRSGLIAVGYRVLRRGYENCPATGMDQSVMFDGCNPAFGMCSVGPTPTPTTPPTATPTLAPTATPTPEPTATPLLTARPGAAGLGDPLFPGLGNGGYNVVRYTVDLDVDVDANTIAGHAQIEANATQDLATFNLDFRGLTVTAVEVDGQSAGYSRSGSEMKIRPVAPIPKGTTFNATVSYQGHPLSGPCPGE